MGCASLTEPIVAMVQMPSLGAVQPMENSPPGIHAMPDGALVGAEVLLAMVGANGEAALVSVPAAAGRLQPTTAMMPSHIHVLRASGLTGSRFIPVFWRIQFMTASGKSAVTARRFSLVFTRVGCSPWEPGSRGLN